MSKSPNYISEEDRAIILGLAEGLPYKEIAESLNCPENKIKNRVFYLRHEIFQARSTAHLVALSYHYGILKSPTDQS